MSLPRPPISLNTPIPNEPFSAEEVYYLEGNQGHLPLGAGLYIDPRNGEFTDIEPSPYIYCTPQYANLPVTLPPYGCVTEVNTAGVTDFTDAWNGCSLNQMPCVDTSSGQNFYYCFYGNNWQSFPKLNVSEGTYFAFAWGDNTSLEQFPLLNTSKGENFEGTWYNCESLISFPKLDFSSAIVLGDSTNLGYGTWESCTSLTSFPLIDFKNVEVFDYGWWNCESLESFPAIDASKGSQFLGTWSYCRSLISFPEIDVSSGVNFQSTWRGCESLTSFPALNFQNAQQFGHIVYSGSGAWQNCTSLTTFPPNVFDNCPAINFRSAWYNCALSQQSVDNILISLDTAGQSNGIVNIDGGTSSAPGAAGLAAKASLEAKGWTVTVNGVSPLGDYAEEAKFEFPNDPKPGQLFTSPEGKKYKWGRSRLENGWFAADIPSTPEDEAWEWLLIEDSPQEEK